MLTKKRITLGVAIMAIICLFLFWPANQPGGIDASVATVEYPRAWARIGLPQLPGASMKAKNGSNLEDGIDFELEINKPANQIGNYYEEQFKDRDFDHFVPDESNEENYTNSFQGGDIGVSIDISPDPLVKGRSRVKIWIEKERRRSFNTNNASIRVD